MKDTRDIIFTGISKSLTEEVRNLKKNGAQNVHGFFEPPCITI